MTTAAVPRTATPYGPDLIARGLHVYVGIDAHDEMVPALLAGTVTAREVLRLLDPHVGVWWGIMGTFGDLEDFEDYAYTDDLLADTYADLDGGEVSVVLIAKRPTRNGQPWDPEIHNPPEAGGLMGNSYLVDHESVELVEVRYNAGKGWHSLPANGIRVQAARMAGPIYRGMCITLSPEQVQMRRAGQWVPLANSIARQITAQGASHGWHDGGVPTALGMYWSHSLEVAGRFAGSPSREDLLSVVVEARYDETAEPGKPTGYGFRGEQEQEQTLAPGTRVEIDALRLRDTRGNWFRVTMNGLQATAAYDGGPNPIVHTGDMPTSAEIVRVKASRTAGANGGLPEGIEFRYVPDRGTEGRAVIGPGAVLYAYLNGEEIGGLSWFTQFIAGPMGHQAGQIEGIYVAEPYQRLGIATELFRRAREIEPRLHHSHSLTDEGRAWSQTTAKVRPLPEVWYHGASERRAQETAQSGFPADYRPTNGELGPGIYLTTSPKTGNLYGDLVTRSGRPGAVMQLKARFDNPYVSPDGAVVDNVNRRFGTHLKTGKEVNAFLREQGYDALVVHFMNETWAVVFDPAKVSYVSHVPSVDRKQFGKTAIQQRPQPDPVEYRHTPPTRWPGSDDRDGGYHTISARLEGKQIGYLQWWDPEDGPYKDNPSMGPRVEKVEVATAHRRKGLATEMLRRAREITPGIKHSDRLTGDGRAWRNAESPSEAGLPAYPKSMRSRLGAAALDPVALEHWRPTGGMFAPGMKTLDPRIFDLRTEQMLPAVRQSVLDHLDAYWTPLFGHWQDWARVYLAGSGASYWWDSDTDLDLMVGVDLDRLRAVRPANKDVADDEIIAHLNKTLMDLRPSMAAMVFEPGTKPMDVTYFVNADSWDIRHIHPYAAYELTDGMTPPA